MLLYIMPPPLSADWQEQWARKGGWIGSYKLPVVRKKYLKELRACKNQSCQPCLCKNWLKKVFRRATQQSKVSCTVEIVRVTNFQKIKPTIKFLVCCNLHHWVDNSDILQWIRISQRKNHLFCGSSCSLNVMENLASRCFNPKHCWWNHYI